MSDAKSHEKRAYDLEERTFEFALSTRRFITRHQWSLAQETDVKQLLRSSGSVAANYTEANNAGSKKEFAYRISVTKRESSESRLWIRLLGSTSTDEETKNEARQLFKEADELTRIFAAIHAKCQPASEADV